MKRLGWVPILLLGASLLALITMVVLRTVKTNRARAAIESTNTVVMQTLEAQQTEAARPTATALPSNTPTPDPTETEDLAAQTPGATLTVAATPTIDPACNIAFFVADVTVPDKMEFDPGVKFTKTWRLYNDGTCTWTTRYKIYFYSGEIMGGPESKQLTVLPVEPGKTIDVSVDLRAPENSGTYKGYWALKNPLGQHFGMGPGGNPIYVEIVVVGGAPAPSPTP